MSKKLKISFVIPAYNEAAGIRACLQSIADQTTAPYEVIVIDNNSSDDTAVIARSFGFVKLLKEKKQGMIVARNTGFINVSGDIIARIDGDSILPLNWVETVQKTLESDLSLVGCTGPLYFYDLPAKKLLTFLHYIAYFGLGRLLFWRQLFFGSNMAFRAKYLPLIWQRAKDDTAGVHEDIDLSLCLSSEGKIKFVWRQKVGIGFYKAAGSPLKVIKRLTGFFFIWRYSFFR